MKNRIRNKNRVGGVQQSRGEGAELSPREEGADPPPVVNQSQANSLSKDNPFSSPNFHFLALTSPYILIGFFVLNTIFNQNIKGIVYVIGIIVLYSFSNLFHLFSLNKHNTICNLIGSKVSFMNPYFGSMVYGYTFSYLFIPMLSTTIINYSLILSLMLLIVVDVVVKNSINCLKIPQFILFLSFSFAFGIGYVFLIRLIDPKLLYYEDYTSDKQVCSIPSEQKFKCNVYRNGELITETTA